MTQLNDLLTLPQLEGDTLADNEGQVVDPPALLSQFVLNTQQSGMMENHIKMRNPA